MTTSNISIETTENVTTVTEYSFNVFATETKFQISTVSVVVDEDEYNNEAYVWEHHSCENYTSKEKFFKDADEAHFYALKRIKTLKDKIK